MKRTALIAGLFVAAFCSIYINARYAGGVTVYNVFRASIMPIFLGIIAFFIVFNVERFTFKLFNKLFKPIRKKLHQ